MHKFLQSKKKIGPIHTVKRGETVLPLLGDYGLAASLLKDLNNIHSDRRLSVGTVIALASEKICRTAKFHMIIHLKSGGNELCSIINPTQQGIISTKQNCGTRSER